MRMKISCNCRMIPHVSEQLQIYSQNLDSMSFGTSTQACAVDNLLKVCMLYAFVTLVTCHSAVWRQVNQRQTTSGIDSSHGSRTGVIGCLTGRAMDNVSVWSASLALEICCSWHIAQSSSPISSTSTTNRWRLHASSSCITGDCVTKFVPEALESLTLPFTQNRILYGITCNPFV